MPIGYGKLGSASAFDQNIMEYIKGESRDQELLLPESLEDYVSQDNPVRFIEGFVDKIDMSECGFERIQCSGTPELRSARLAQALPLRLLQPNAIQSHAGAGLRHKPRGDLADASPQARPQDHRRAEQKATREAIQEKEPEILQAGLSQVRIALPNPRPSGRRTTPGRT